ncbi:hypothetical protein GC194_14715 [bacterium]|nr:hypothetical protein [bacterium]
MKFFVAALCMFANVAFAQAQKQVSIKCIWVDDDQLSFLIKPGDKVHYLKMGSDSNFLAKTFDDHLVKIGNDSVVYFEHDTVQLSQLAVLGCHKPGQVVAFVFFTGMAYVGFGVFSLTFLVESIFSDVCEECGFFDFIFSTYPVSIKVALVTLPFGLLSLHYDNILSQKRKLTALHLVRRNFTQKKTLRFGKQKTILKRVKG